MVFSCEYTNNIRYKQFHDSSIGGCDSGLISYFSVFRLTGGYVVVYDHVMTTQMKPAQEIIKDILTDLYTSVNTVVPSRAGANMVKSPQMSATLHAPVPFRNIIYVAAMERLRDQRKRLGFSSLSAEEIRYESIAFVTYMMLSAVATTNPDASNPKIHHWMPYFYLKGFNTGTVAGARRSCSILSLTISKSGMTHESTVTDMAFAHPPVDGVGFYNLRMEHFYAKIEGSFANVIQNRIADAGPDIALTDQDRVNVLAFFAVQSRRNPDIIGDFNSKSIDLTIDEIAEAFDYEATPHINAVGALPFLMPFTPYIPQRIRTTSDGNRMMVFGCNSRTAFVVSHKEITHREANASVVHARASIVRTAQRNGTPIFGVTAEDIKDLI